MDRVSGLTAAVFLDSHSDGADGGQHACNRCRRSAELRGTLWTIPVRRINTCWTTRCRYRLRHAAARSTLKEDGGGPLDSPSSGCHAGHLHAPQKLLSCRGAASCPAGSNSGTHHRAKPAPAKSSLEGDTALTSNRGLAFDVFPQPLFPPREKFSERGHRCHRCGRLNFSRREEHPGRTLCLEYPRETCSTEASNADPTSLVWLEGCKR